jgi:hypothetical protein
MKHALKSGIATLALALLPFAVSAHGSLFTFKQIDGENVIMVTQNVHDAQSGIPITYNLKLYNLDGQLTPFQRVEVDMRQNERSLTKQILNITANKDVDFTYKFPRQGEYHMVVSFIDNGKAAAQSDFPLIVQKGLEQNFFADFLTVQALITFLLGAGVASAAFWHRRKITPFLAKLRRRK